MLEAIGVIILLFGTYHENDWDHYLNNKPFETECNVFNVSINECVYDCDCHGQDTMMECETCNGFNYTFQAVANMNSDCGDMDSYKIVEHKSNCTGNITAGWNHILDKYHSNNNTNTYSSCWIASNCSDTFYAYDFSRNFEPEYSQNTAHGFFIIGIIFMSISGLALMCLVMVQSHYCFDKYCCTKTRKQNIEMMETQMYDQIYSDEEFTIHHL